MSWMTDLVSNFTKPGYLFVGYFEVTLLVSNPFFLLLKQHRLAQLEKYEYGLKDSKARIFTWNLSS